MYTVKETLHSFEIKFPLEQYASLDKILFLDIETTGLSPASSQLYLIGIAYYEDHLWHIEQWFAKDSNEEAELLCTLAKTLPNYELVIHFNGNRFDIPYLTQKAKTHSIELALDQIAGIDLYKRLAPLKRLLGLPDCRQKTIEQYLGINRLDQYSGGELINIYKNYVKTPTETSLQLLTQHNRDDMKGMLDIIPALSYYELFHTNPTVTRVEMLKSKNLEQKEHYELLISSKLPFSVPKKLFVRFDGNFLSTDGDRATLKVPVYEEELKLYYAGYKDYVYIPVLDAAYHKSVASHIPKEHKKQATSQTCYTRKYSLFLKQYNKILVEPFFKRNHNDKETFFEITEEIKTNRSLFSRYYSHILHVILENI